LRRPYRRVVTPPIPSTPASCKVSSPVLSRW